MFDSVSSMGIFVMDCRLRGAPPPMRSEPALTCLVFLRLIMQVLRTCPFQLSAERPGLKYWKFAEKQVTASAMQELSLCMHCN
jgi:hypothetical protein